MVVGNWSVTVERQGAEGESVVVIDGFAADPAMFADDAAMLGFAPVGIHYPGVRAAVARSLLKPLLAALAPVIADVFGYQGSEIDDAFYSLVTTPPGTLTPIQRIPHFDGVEPERLALLHYLSPDMPGGTAFYRHRATGFETVTAARLSVYRAALDADLACEGVPEAAYIAGDTGLYECVARHEGRFNRALLYRGNMLHCAWLPDAGRLVDDPAKGRLTVNTFLRGLP
jgi:Family of unknown function (DUF6445)